MILENRTRYRSADLERVILLALEEAGITAHARDKVEVGYDSRGFSGFCYFGHVTPPRLLRGKGPRSARMVLRVPSPDPKPPRPRGDCPTHKVASVEDGRGPDSYPGSVFFRCPHGCRFIETATERKAKDPGPFDVDAFVWLVRHEVGHWRGLAHTQMAPTLRRWKDWTDAGRPLPPWAAGLAVALEDAPPARPRKPPPDREAERCGLPDY